MQAMWKIGTDKQPTSNPLAHELVYNTVTRNAWSQWKLERTEWSITRDRVIRLPWPVYNDKTKCWFKWADINFCRIRLPKNVFEYDSINAD
jgi:hypothetical protein